MCNYSFFSNVILTLEPLRGIGHVTVYSKFLVVVSVIEAGMLPQTLSSTVITAFSSLLASTEFPPGLQFVIRTCEISLSPP